MRRTTLFVFSKAVEEKCISLLLRYVFDWIDCKSDVNITIKDEKSWMYDYWIYNIPCDLNIKEYRHVTLYFIKGVTANMHRRWEI